jgi:hypothetical protein
MTIIYFYLILITVHMFPQYNDDSCTLFRSPGPEILYQIYSIKCNPDKKPAKWRKSFTYTLESYQRKAWEQYNLVLMNLRRPEHEIIVNYLEEFYIEEIQDKFRLIKEYLQKQQIIAFSVVEITRDKSKIWPINQIHYHFLITSNNAGSISENLLREVFKEACRYAGLVPDAPDTINVPDAPNQNCIVHYSPIPDPKRDRDRYGNLLTYDQAFNKRVRYILKCNTMRKPILFRSGTGINKIASIGRYFINPDGSRADKGLMWAKWCILKYPKSAAEKFLQEIIQYLPKITVKYSGAVRIGDKSYHWNK